MYEFLSNTKDENNSWSVNSSVREQVASPLPPPLAPTPQVNAPHQILKGYFAELCCTLSFALHYWWKESEWKELHCIPHAGGLCHFSGSKTQFKSSWWGLTHPDLQRGWAWSSIPANNRFTCEWRHFPSQHRPGLLCSFNNLQAHLQCWGTYRHKWTQSSLR